MAEPEEGEGGTIGSERRLAVVCAALVGEPSDAPLELWARVRARIEAGDDPLGEAFCRLRPARRRRADGAIYTPWPIVTAMVRWAARQGEPARVVDPGCGSGRYLVACAEAFPHARLVGIDTDPLAVAMTRANAAVRGFADRLEVWNQDYRACELPRNAGATLFIGNPPYVRHHDIAPLWKAWFVEAARRHGVTTSALAGLHVHFMLKTCELARPGDLGCFITSSEWLDVNYGGAVRGLLADGLGGVALHILEPGAMPFDDAMVTGAISCFRVGGGGEVLRVRRVETLEALGGLEDGEAVPWSRLEGAPRWSPLIRHREDAPAGWIELGEICRVSRGQVTGDNKVWLAHRYPGRLPERFLVPAITRAKELFDAAGVLRSAGHLRRVIDLPASLERLTAAEREQALCFLAWAEQRGAHTGYIARHRRPWWRVRLLEPAPIICTYMARRPPAFVRNLCSARHLNIAHGIHPKVPMDGAQLDRLARFLSGRVGLHHGRTYAGGLTKFEPKELERVRVPAALRGAVDQAA